jgi:hypothetical protein
MGTYRPDAAPQSAASDAGHTVTLEADDAVTLGSATWVEQTSGWLTAADRRALLPPLVGTHARMAAGRIGLLLRLDSGRHAWIDPERLVTPKSTLAQAAENTARLALSPALLNHSHRTYVFGCALGALEGIEFDPELLFAAAMLHDTGLIDPAGNADFTVASSRLAREVAQQVGLSTAATETMRTAITMHLSPGVGHAAGPVAYLLSAGAAVDVVGLRSWQLPPSTLSSAVSRHPRADFKRVFTEAFQREAARVPQGRVKFLHRYGAFAAAIRFAPFDE